jgi:uncharacterized small protein (DUF1192 family)
MSRNVKGAGARTVNSLSFVQQVELDKLLIAEYAESKKTDIDFAAYAAVKLGFSITVHNVLGARRARGMINNFPNEKKPKAKPAPSGDSDALLAMIAGLEKRLAANEAEIDTLRVKLHLPKLTRPAADAQFSFNLGTGEVSRH